MYSAIINKRHLFSHFCRDIEMRWRRIYDKKEEKAVCHQVYHNCYHNFWSLCTHIDLDQNTADGGLPIFSFTEEQAGLVTSMIEGAVGAIAAGVVRYELGLNAGVEARQNDIEEAQFLLEFNQAFIQDEKMCEIEHRLEQWMEGTLERGTLVNDGNRQRFINYLVYLEGLAPLIFRDILKLEHIDDLMAYRFFLALNNRELQEDQLFRYPEYFRGCFKLYAVWKNYRTRNGYPIPLSEYAVDFWPEFEKYSESLVTVRELRSASDRKRAAGLIYDTDPFPISIQPRLAADAGP